MNSSNLSALLLLILFFCSTPIALACRSCRIPPSPRTPRIPPSPRTPRIPPSPRTPRIPPSPRTPRSPKGPINLPPITLPPIPITLPPIPIITPIIGNPPTTPVIGTPPITLPPISLPPLFGTPPPASEEPGCPPPPAATTCPIDTLKLGACVSLLGSTVHVGDAAVECCPFVEGLAGVQAAACLCTTIKAKLLDTKAVLPIALQLLVTCGNAVPPDYTCPV